MTESREMPSPLAQSQNAGLVTGLAGRSRVRFPVGAVGEFSSPELTFCADLFRYPFHPRVTALAHNRLRSFCKGAGGRLQLMSTYMSTHTLFTERSLCGLTELSR